MAGLPESKVRELSASLWASEMGRATTAQRVTSPLYGDFTLDGGIRVHAEVADLLRALRDRQWDVWIVTASNQYVAEEAARHLGVGSARVRGIRSKRQKGVLTPDLEPPVTYREGKAQVLEKAGVRPYLALGDSMTDFEMLTGATIAIVIDRGRIPRGATTGRWYWQPQSALSTRVMAQ
jgi:phosphoserine phosphatase